MKIRRRIYYLVGIVLVLLALFQISKYAVLCFNSHGVDFDKHYRAYTLIMKGQNPYLGPNYLLLNYPVFTIWLFGWLQLFDFHTAERLWDVWNLAMVIISALIVSLFYKPTKTMPHNGKSESSRQFRDFVIGQWRIWGFFLLLYYLPPIVRMYDGNLEPTMLIFLVLFGAAYFNDRDFLAGVFLALSAMIKVMTIFVLPCVLIMGRWRIAKGMAATFVVYGFVLLATGQWRWEWILFSDVLLNASYEWQGVSASLVCFMADYIVTPAKTNPALFHTLSVITNSILLSATILVLIIAQPRKKNFENALSFSFLLLPLLSPLLEYHHHTWVVVAYFIFVRQWLAGKSGGTWCAVQFCLWLIVLFTGYLVDLGFPTYYPATLSVMALWLLHGVSLVSSKDQDVY